MTEEAGIIREYKRNFILDETKLRRIVDLIHTHSRKLTYDTYIKYRVVSEHSAYYETRDIEEVLNDDNTAGKAIVRLVIILMKAQPTGKRDKETTEEAKDLVSLDFRPSQTDKITLVVKGENRDWCFLLFDDLDTQISRTLSHNIPAFFLDIEFDLLALFILLAISLSVVSLFLWAKQPFITPDAIAKMTMDQKTQKILELIQRNDFFAYSWAVPLLFIVLAALIAFLVIRPFSRLFRLIDRSFFKWGDMVSTHEKYQRRIRNVIWGVVTGFIVSTAAGVLVARFFTR